MPSCNFYAETSRAVLSAYRRTSRCRPLPQRQHIFAWNHNYIHAATELQPYSKIITTRKLNYVTRVRERTIPTERQPLVGEVSADFGGYRLPRSQRDGSIRPYSRFSRPEPLLFLLSSFSIVLTRLSGHLSRPTISQKIWERLESNPDLWIYSK
jgi:hypothetical protein